MPNPSALQHLASRTFEIGVVAAATGLPAARITEWVKRGVFTTLEPAHPGTGSRRTFHVVDAIYLKLLGELTDTEKGLGLPLKIGTAILDSAILHRDFGLDALKDERGNAWLREEAVRQLRSGHFLAPLDDLAQPCRLIAGPVNYVSPEVRFWRGDLCPVGEGAAFNHKVLPNRKKLPFAGIMLDVTPHVRSVIRALLDALGVLPLFPDYAEAPDHE
ncbi:hypothetical protein ACQW02_25635 [Humitalea sp. 24SJ18S-53]|uniref:hypothetical protein n=1 Tax=Humitalea sp. 24SJ18S-53 TaxID=3422307 RepID=UPI003D6726B2